MPIELHNFKRLVLGLQPGAPERTMRLAVDLAELLNLELLGIFLKDTSLHNLANIPFARELRPLGGGWHPIDVKELSHDLDVTARSAEKLCGETASDTVAIRGRPGTDGRYHRCGLANQRHRNDRRAWERRRTGHSAIFLANRGSFPISGCGYGRAAADRAGPRSNRGGGDSAERPEHRRGSGHRACGK